MTLGSGVICRNRGPEGLGWAQDRGCALEEGTMTRDRESRLVETAYGRIILHLCALGREVVRMHTCRRVLWHLRHMIIHP